MVKKFHLVLGVIPIAVALLISIPMLTKTEIPISAANSFDRIDIEYTKHQLKKISYGVTERTGSQKTEILSIKDNGDIKYTLTDQGYIQPNIESKLDPQKLNKIKALIKETGFMTIQSQSFEILDDVTEYQKSNVRIILNGRTNQVHWPEQNATDGFIPPIITMVETELDAIINDIKDTAQR